ncbi:MAG: metallopeptidase family protein [Candidatus Pacebacteria bacterium]|nr:metallopeptidase family protein [Candidatus Paceibacterota bacterium]MBP9832530.1 metallopeptidase family protein [Candidatus Paceibacterota bacterium]
MNDDIDDIQMPAMNPGGKSAALVEDGLSPKEFEKIVADAFLLVPEKFSSKVRASAIVIEDTPSDAVLREQNVPENYTLFGLYRSTEAGGGVIIFRNPVLHAAAHEAGVEVEWGAPTEPMKRRLRTIVRDIIWHEIARHFDMDEFEIDAREETGTTEFK